MTEQNNYSTAEPETAMNPGIPFDIHLPHIPKNDAEDNAMKFTNRHHNWKVVTVLSFIFAHTMIVHSQCTTTKTVTMAEATNPAAANFNLEKIVDNIHTPQSDLILVTAHRGSWEYCPENSLEGLNAAMDAGVESVELDVRITAPGTYTNDSGASTLFPNGRTYLTHDYDLRAEAVIPNGVHQRADNLIYDLSPNAANSRQMLDRFGNVYIDKTTNNPEPRASLTDVLTQQYARGGYLTGGMVKAGTPAAASLERAPAIYCGGVVKRDVYKLVRGAFLIIDIKGESPAGFYTGSGSVLASNPNAVTQYSALLQALNEFYAFQCTYNVDMSDAVAFKIGAGRMMAPTQFKLDLQSNGLDLYSTALQGNDASNMEPKLILIVFPWDYDPDADKYKQVTSQNITAYEDTYPGYLMNDWQLWWFNSILTDTIYTKRQNNKPVAAFVGANNWPEGIRYSTGNCGANKQFNSPLGSSCYSQPAAGYGGSSPDYLQALFTDNQKPNTSLSPVTSVTTDLFQNEIRFLQLLGYRNLSYIK